MVRHKTDTLTALIGQGYWLKLSCACGHTAKIDPMPLRMALHDRGARDTLDGLNARMRCQRCGERSFRAEPCYGPATWSEATEKG